MPPAAETSTTCVPWLPWSIGRAAPDAPTPPAATASEIEPPLTAAVAVAPLARDIPVRAESVTVPRPVDSTVSIDRPPLISAIEIAPAATALRPVPAVSSTFVTRPTIAPCVASSTIDLPPTLASGFVCTMLVLAVRVVVPEGFRIGPLTRMRPPRLDVIDTLAASLPMKSITTDWSARNVWVETVSCFFSSVHFW